MVTLKIGLERVELNGQDVTDSIIAVEIKMAVEELSEVKLTLRAEVQADIEVSLLKLEKAGHIRFSSLDNSRSQFVRVKNAG